MLKFTFKIIATNDPQNTRNATKYRFRLYHITSAPDEILSCENQNACCRMNQKYEFCASIIIRRVRKIMNCDYQKL